MKNRKLYLLVSILVVIAGLGLSLPLLPQTALQSRLTGDLNKILQQPCRIGRVNLQVFPRPAVILQDFTSSSPKSGLQSSRIALDFSLLSLVRLVPEIAGVRLDDLYIKTPFTGLNSFRPEDDSPAKDSDQFISLATLTHKIRAQVATLKYIEMRNANCELTGIPGIFKPLVCRDFSGNWRVNGQNSSESLELAGKVSSGQADIKMTWYQIDKKINPAVENSSVFVENRIEISGHLQNVSLSDCEIESVTDADKSLKYSFVKGDLDFDVNGNPETGLRFSGRFSAFDHNLIIYDSVSDSEKLCSQGAVKLSVNGFWQRRDGYVNIKSAALEYPGVATLFARGLVRFNKPIFVDLVNDLKIEDLTLLGQKVPFLEIPGYKLAGRLAGGVKIIGNPRAVPVLQIKLDSEKIVVSKNESLPVLPAASNSTSSPEDGISIAVPVAAVDQQMVKFLESVAKWECSIKSDCRIKSLQFPEMAVSDLEFSAEKSLVQLEIERLAARFGESGQLQLSLVLEDILDAPHWQASLTAKKLELQPFQKILGLTGILNASLVGGGQLRSDSDLVRSLDLNGKWHLGRGAFLDSTIYTSFYNFLVQNQHIPLEPGFSACSGKIVLRDGVLRLSGFRLKSGKRQVKASGRLFTRPRKLQFRGQLIDESSPLFSFLLNGNYSKPLFSLPSR